MTIPDSERPEVVAEDARIAEENIAEFVERRDAIMDSEPVQKRTAEIVRADLGERLVEMFVAWRVVQRLRRSADRGGRDQMSGFEFAKLKAMMGLIAAPDTPVAQPATLTDEQLDAHARDCSTTAMMGCRICAEYCDREMAKLMGREASR